MYQQVVEGCWFFRSLFHFPYFCPGEISMLYRPGTCSALEKQHSVCQTFGGNHVYGAVATIAQLVSLLVQIRGDKIFACVCVSRSICVVCNMVVLSDTKDPGVPGSYRLPLMAWLQHILWFPITSLLCKDLEQSDSSCSIIENRIFLCNTSLMFISTILVTCFASL